MVTEIPRAILENKALPDWGEPVDPLRRKTWTQRLLGMPRRPSRPTAGRGAGAAIPGEQGRRPGSAPTTVLKIK